MKSGKLQTLIKEVHEVLIQDIPIQLSKDEVNLIEDAVRQFYKGVVKFGNVGEINVGSVMVALNALKTPEGDDLKQKVFTAFTSPLAKKIRLTGKGDVVTKPSSFN
jgi:adenine C2-methylase RlmN of 23S rRNA A2503 and tRNA A37